MKRARMHAARVVLAVLAAGVVYWSVTTHVALNSPLIPYGGTNPVVAVLVLEVLAFIVGFLAAGAALIYLVRWAVGK